MEKLLIVFLPIGFVLTMYAVIILLAVNIATSSIKVIHNQCDKTYGIESVPLVTGNWFCSK